MDECRRGWVERMKMLIGRDDRRWTRREREREREREKEREREGEREGGRETLREIEISSLVRPDHFETPPVKTKTHLNRQHYHKKT